MPIPPSPRILPRPLLRALAAGALLGGLGLAAAQPPQPLVSPAYSLRFLPALEDGAPVEGVLDREDGQNFRDGARVDLYALDGEAGELLTLTLASADFDAYLSVFTPSGALLDSNDDDWDGMGTDSRLVLTLPEDGRYLVVATSFWTEGLGSYTLLRRAGEVASEGAPSLVLDAEARPLDLPAALSSELTADMAPIDPYGGSAERWSFTLERPALVMLEVASQDFDTVLGVYRADDGTEIAYNDDDPDAMGTDSALQVELEPGEYIAVVSSFFSGSHGRYALDARAYQAVD